MQNIYGIELSDSKGDMKAYRTYYSITWGAYHDTHFFDACLARSPYEAYEKMSKNVEREFSDRYQIETEKESALRELAENLKEVGNESAPVEVTRDG